MLTAQNPLFSCHDGALYDTRIDGWHKLPPLRPVFQKHFQQINTTAEFKATLRAGPFAWPGIYPLYFLTSDGGVLSFAAARECLKEILWAIEYNDGNSGWRVVACEINYEDDELICDHTGEFIPSAYGGD